MLSACVQSWNDYWHKCIIYRGFSSILDFYVPILMNAIIFIIIDKFCVSIAVFSGGMSNFVSDLAVVYLFICFVPLLSLGYRRVSDTGLRGYLFLVAFILLLALSLLGLFSIFRILLFIVLIVICSFPSGYFLR